MFLIDETGMRHFYHLIVPTYIKPLKKRKNKEVGKILHFAFILPEAEGLALKPFFVTDRTKIKSVLKKKSIKVQHFTLSID